MELKNQFLTLMSEMSPVKTLDAVIEIVTIATTSPAVVAEIVRPIPREEHVSSQPTGRSGCRRGDGSPCRGMGFLIPFV